MKSGSVYTCLCTCSNWVNKKHNITHSNQILRNLNKARDPQHLTTVINNISPRRRHNIALADGGISSCKNIFLEFRSISLYYMPHCIHNILLLALKLCSKMRKLFWRSWWNKKLCEQKECLIPYSLLDL